MRSYLPCPPRHTHTHTLARGSFQSIDGTQTDLNLGPGQESRQRWRLSVPTEVGAGEEGSAG